MPSRVDCAVNRPVRMLNSVIAEFRIQLTFCNFFPQKRKTLFGAFLVSSTILLFKADLADYVQEHNVTIGKILGGEDYLHKTKTQS